MEALSSLVRVSLPNYLKNLPIPDSFSGFANLSGSDWASLLPFVGAVSLAVYITVKAFTPKPSPPPPKVNLELQKESPKVVNLVDVEDLDTEKVCYCRCWRSTKFPYCDGSHNKHNEDTGDNVGPLIVKKSKVNA